jgi:hypothetical protein
VESVNFRILTYCRFLSEITGREGEEVSTEGERNRGPNWKKARVNYFPDGKKRHRMSAAKILIGINKK